MTPRADDPQPITKYFGKRPLDGSRAPAPLELAFAVREHAITRGFSVVRMARSRVRLSGSFHLEMTDGRGRQWNVRISEHRRPTRTDYAIPHVDIVSLDGKTGVAFGRQIVDAIIAGDVPWFDSSATVRRLQHAKHRKGKRGAAK